MNSKIIFPVLLTFALVIGILVGVYFTSPHIKPSNEVDINFKKVKEVIGLINQEYVDEVDLNELTESAIKSTLNRLDPHSIYIPAKEREMSEISIESNYEGIGIEFNIFEDTLRVITALSGGPSQKLGILPADKIISIDSQNVAGIGLDNKMVFEKLRGPKGSEVHLEILRNGINRLLDFQIIRDKIPSHSLDASYMINESMGYVKISRFSQSTSDEFRNALLKLKASGMKQLILDLRNNSGGILSSALIMVDELLTDGELILYTKSQNANNAFEYNSRMPGLFESGEIVVLINEGSASASEIVAGALQDQDRAIIIGRRSFGKGLVQSSFDLSDGSEFRMTISRYFIPSGRSIQKPYSEGKRTYMSELVERYDNGEYFHSDSIKVADTLKFYTSKGRMVFGGGGIIPDYFIPRDTSYFSDYFLDLSRKGIINEFAFEYANENRLALEKSGFENFKMDFKISNRLIAELKKFSLARGVDYSENDFLKSKEMILNQTKSLIARNIWLDNGFYEIFNESDLMIEEAVKLIKKESSLIGELN